MSDMKLNKNLTMLILAESTKGKTYALRNLHTLPGKTFMINADK